MKTVACRKQNIFSNSTKRCEQRGKCHWLLCSVSNQETLMRYDVKALITTAGAMGYWVMLILVDIMDGNAGNIISS